ncbi:hypothetical protein [Thalassobius sp. Cn5-15]|uniref:hypothetical protein n=1 Tax=Thalassobius sp. Cn5-15 TaxID=2917763 RepID=UPI001EF3444D|nr:hypothetical protein [Thalassobius sp. Cn5-15]
MGLINEFLHSPEAKRVQHLQIGVTPKLDQSVGYDLSRLLALFEGKRLPSLKSLSLGDCFLFGCPERDSVFCKGYLGEITPIFTAAPRLEMLDLNGTFCLPAPVQHSKLREVAIEVEMVEAGDDCLTQWSMANLLRSQFARVEALSLVCLGKVQALLDLPADFNPSEGMPRLHQLHMDNLNRESAQRQAALQAFLLAR